MNLLAYHRLHRAGQYLDLNVFEHHVHLLTAVKLHTEIALAHAWVVLQFGSLDAVDGHGHVATYGGDRHFVPVFVLVEEKEVEKVRSNGRPPILAEDQDGEKEVEENLEEEAKERKRQKEKEIKANSPFEYVPTQKNAVKQIMVFF